MLSGGGTKSGGQHAGHSPSPGRTNWKPPAPRLLASPFGPRGDRDYSRPAFPPYAIFLVPPPQPAIEQHRQAGLAAWKHGRPVEAGEHFRQAARLAPHDPASQQTLADWCLNTGDLPGALMHSEQHMAVDVRLNTPRCDGLSSRRRRRRTRRLGGVPNPPAAPRRLKLPAPARRIALRPACPGTQSRTPRPRSPPEPSFQPRSPAVGPLDAALRRRRAARSPRSVR